MNIPPKIKVVYFGVECCFEVWTGSVVWMVLWYDHGINSLSDGGNFESQRDQEKKWIPGGLKEFLPRMFSRGAYSVSCQKTL